MKKEIYIRNNQDGIWTIHKIDDQNHLIMKLDHPADSISKFLIN
jgi:hypothetical protein